MSTISTGTLLTTAFIVRSDLSGTLQIQTGASSANAVYIDSSQNVGIGNTNPGVKLQVTGTTISSNFYTGTGTASAGTFGADSAGTGASIIMYGSTGANPGAMLLYAGGTERMRIDSSGNVGIGTSSPGYKLDVQSTASSGAPLLANFQAAGGDVQLYVQNGTVKTQVTADATNSASIIGSFSAHPLVFRTSNTERMRIDSSGNVGIGTSSPTNFGLNYITTIISGGNAGILQLKGVNNSVDFRVQADSYGLLDVNSNHPMLFRTNATERMRIDTSGNVGIGTSSPTAKLQASGAGETRVFSTNSTASITAQMGADASSAYVGSYTNHPLVFRTNDAERARIDTSGNVGIGTTTPVAQLGVYGAGQTTAAMSTSTGLGGTLYVRDSAGASGNGGAVMFGASQGAFAAIKGLITDGSNNTLGALAFSNRSASTDTTLTERMRIDSSGNVGIGTSSPGVKLDVVGTTNIRHTYTGATGGILFGQYNTTGDAQIQNQSSGGVIAIATNNTERMRIDSSGNLLLGTTSATTAPTGYVSAANTFGFKNRIINGAMVIDQRNVGASITANDAAFPVDRFVYSMSAASKGTSQQSTTTATGFTNSVLFTSSSAYTVGAAEHFSLVQKIEGFNVSDLAWGTASAATVTLSFWVRSSLTGTFGGAISNSALNRSYPFTYTISAANTFEQKTITIAGDTTGTWVTNSGIGMYIFWNLGCGATNSGTAGAWAAATYFSATGATSVVGTNGATFYITGVQLEKGTVFSGFDYRPYGTELDLCLRYYEILNSNYSFPLFVPNGSYLNKVAGTWTYQVQKRATPSLSQISGSTVGVDRFGIGPATISSVGLNASTDTMMTFDITLSASYTTGERMSLTGNKIYQASAEL